MIKFFRFLMLIGVAFCGLFSSLEIYAETDIPKIDYTSEFGFDFGRYNSVSEQEGAKSALGDARIQAIEKGQGVEEDGASIQSASTQSLSGSDAGLGRSSLGLGGNAFQMGDIQLQSGRVSFSETDLQLPGKSGMDLLLGRVYDSGRYTERGGKTIPKRSAFVAREIPKHPGNDGAHSNGVGVVLFDIDGNGQLDLYRVRVDNWRYDMLLSEIGWNLNQRGEASRWSSPVHIGEEIGTCEGASVAAVDLDGNGRKEIIVVAAEDPRNSDNSLYYRIGWNIDTQGRVARWDSYIRLPRNIASNTHGVGLAHADLNRNGRPELIISYTEDNVRPYRTYMKIMWDLDSSGRYRSIGDPISVHHGDLMFGNDISAGDLNGNGIPDLVFAMMDENDREQAKLYYKIAWDMDEEGNLKGWSKQIKSDVGFGVNDNWRTGYGNRTGTGGEWSGGLGADIADIDGDGTFELVASMLDNQEGINSRKMRTVINPIRIQEPVSRDWGGFMGGGWRWALGSRAIVGTHLRPNGRSALSNTRILIDSSGGSSRYEVEGTGHSVGWLISKIPGENGRAKFNASTHEVTYEDGAGKRYVFAEQSYQDGTAQARDSAGPFVGVYYLSRVEDAFGNQIQLRYELYKEQYSAESGHFDGYIGTVDEWNEWVSETEEEQKNVRSSQVRPVRPDLIIDTFGREIQVVYEGGAALGRISENSEPTLLDIRHSEWRKTQSLYQDNRAEVIRGFVYKNQEGADRFVRYRYDSKGMLAGVKEEGLPEQTYGYGAYVPSYRINMGILKNAIGHQGVYYDTDVPLDTVIWDDTVWQMRGFLLEKKRNVLGSELSYRYEEQLSTDYHSETVGNTFLCRYNFQSGDSHPVVIEKVIDENPGGAGGKYRYGIAYPKGQLWREEFIRDQKVWEAITRREGLAGEWDELIDNIGSRFEAIRAESRNKKTEYTVSYLGEDIKQYFFNRVIVTLPEGLGVETYEFEKGKLKKKSLAINGSSRTKKTETENVWDHDQNRLNSSTDKIENIIQFQHFFELYDSKNRVIRLVMNAGTLGRPGYQQKRIETMFEETGNNADPVNYHLVKQEKETRTEGTSEQSRLKITRFDEKGNVIESYTTAEGAGILQSGQKRNHATYQYDSAGRLTGGVQWDAPGGPIEKETIYQYIPRESYLITERLRPVGGGASTVKETVSIVDPYTGKIRETIDINGNRTQNRYDSVGRMVEEIFPNNTRRTWSYSSDLTEVSETYEGRTVRKKTDRLGRLWYTDNPAGEEDEGFDYGPGGRITAAYTGQVPGSWMLRKRYTYDFLGRILTEEVPGFGTTQYLYNDETKEVIVQNPEGKQVGKKQNIRGELISSWESLGTGEGLVVTSGSGNPSGRIEQTYAYDAWGNVVQAKDERGRFRGSSYTIFGELNAAYFPKLQGSPDLVKSRVFRDEKGVIQRSQILTESGQVHKEVSPRYDSEGRITATLVNGVLVEELVYDQGLDGETNAKGRVGKVTHFNADSDGNGHTVVTDYGYDVLGRVTREKTTIKVAQTEVVLKEHSIKTQYANHGGISEIEYPDGKKIQYTYDTATRRVTGITYDGKAIANYSYNINGTISRMQMGNGLTHDYLYDGTHINRAHLLTKLKSRNRSNNEIYYEQDFSYDTHGKLIQTEYKDPIANRRRAAGSGSGNSNNTGVHDVTIIKKGYRYTKRNELMAVDLTTEKYSNSASNMNAVMSLATVKNQGGMPQQQQTSNYYRYLYDETGNALTYSHASPQRPEQTTREIHRVKDELTTQLYSDGRRIQLTYDTEGNVTRKVRTYPDAIVKTFKSNNNAANSKTQTTDYAYDLLSRLKNVTVSGEGVKATYVYNHKNERVLETLPSSANHNRYGSGTKVTYWSSQGQAIAEGYISSETVGSQPYTVRYIYSGNQKIAMIRPDKNGVERIFYFINNPQGTPLYIMDESGNLVSKIRMDEWGNVASVQGHQSEINYTGKKLDSETGLYYFSQRYYDPEIGRFLTHDPANQSTNPYLYAGNNPMRYIDPDGQFFMEMVTAAVAMAAISMSSQYILYGEVNWDSVAQSALMGAISGGMSFGIGQIFDQGVLSVGQFTAKTLAHGISGGIQSNMVGGDFNSGFASGAIGHLGGHFGGKGYWQSTGVAALSGGAAAWATGGDFYWGASNAAFVNSFDRFAGAPLYKGLQAIGSRLVPRYGNFGGPGWTGGYDGEQPPINEMDALFKAHDNAYINKQFVQGDKVLVRGLKELNSKSSQWNTKNKNSSTLYSSGYRKAAIWYFSTKLKFTD